MELNGRTIHDVEVSGVDPRDYPDFCDAYFYSASYSDGTPLTDRELDQLQDLYPEILNQMAFERLVDHSDSLCYNGA